MRAVRKDRNGKPLLDKEGKPVLLVPPERQQMIRREQDNAVLGYVHFNKEDTHINLILPPSQFPAGFSNHVAEYIKSQYPDCKPIRGSQVPEMPQEIEPEQDSIIYTGDDFDE